MKTKRSGKTNGAASFPRCTLRTSDIPRPMSSSLIVARLDQKRPRRSVHQLPRLMRTSNECSIVATRSPGTRRTCSQMHSTSIHDSANSLSACSILKGYRDAISWACVPMMHHDTNQAGCDRDMLCSFSVKYKPNAQHLVCNKEQGGIKLRASRYPPSPGVPLPPPPSLPAITPSTCRQRCGTRDSMTNIGSERGG